MKTEKSNTRLCDLPQEDLSTGSWLHMEMKKRGEGRNPRQLINEWNCWNMPAGEFLDEVTAKTVTEKIAPLGALQFSDCKQAFAVPGDSNIIDVVNPVTGKSWVFGETLEEIRLRYPGAEIVNLEEFWKAKAEQQDAPVEWIEETGDQHWEMLEVLPPACMLGGGFLVGEPWDHHAGNGQPRYQAHIQRGGKYLVSNRPMTVKEFKALFVDQSASVAAEMAVPA